MTTNPKFKNQQMCTPWRLFPKCIARQAITLMIGDSMVLREFRDFDSIFNSGVPLYELVWDNPRTERLYNTYLLHRFKGVTNE